MANTTRPIKALLMDADGVVQYPRPGWLREMARLGGPGFFRAATKAERHSLTGEVDLRPLIEDLLQARGLAIGFEEVLEIWCRIDPDKRMLALVDQVRATGVVTALATNQQSYRGTWMLENLPFERSFDIQFHSWQVGLAKPDPEFFTHIVNSLGLEPDEAVFVDDLHENVMGAHAAGLHAVHFSILSTYGELRWQLRELGVPGV